MEEAIQLLSDPRLAPDGSEVFGPEGRQASDILAQLRVRTAKQVFDRKDDQECIEIDFDDCDEDEDLREILCSILPQDLKYKLKKAKIIENNELATESKFHAEFDVNVCKKEDKDSFIEDLEIKTETNFNARSKEYQRQDFVSQRFNCSRNVKEQRKEAPEERRRHGSGQQLGSERQEGKNTKCEAYFSYKFKECKAECNKEKGDCFSLFVKVHFDHNHEVSSTDSWNFLAVTKQTKQRYTELFEANETASKAKLIYTEELKAKLGEEGFFRISSKRSINPDSATVFNMHTKYFKKFGTINGPDSYAYAVEVSQSHLHLTCTLHSLPLPGDQESEREGR